MTPSVLVVSGRPELRASVAASLHELGAAILFASTEDEALQAASRADVAVALVDATVPGVSARSIARHLHDVKRSQPVPVLLIMDAARSAAMEPDDRELGIADVVAEPVDPAATCARVRPYLELSSQRDTIHQQSVLLQQMRQRELAGEVLRQREQQETLQLRTAGRTAVGMARNFEALIEDMLARCATLALMISTTDPARERLTQLSRALRRSAELVRGLLSAGEPPASRVMPDPVRLNDVVIRVVDEVRPDLPAGITLETRLSNRILQVCIEQKRLEQVLRCLIGNAREAMPCGGRLTVETLLEEIQRPGPRRGGSVATPAICLSVSDTGVGMDIVTRSHMFEPFFTTKGPVSGVGLDLYVAQRVIAQCGGSIEVDSVPGQGTRFTVYLPRASAAGQRAAVPADRGPDPDPVDCVRGTVLLVEDDDPLRDMVRLILEQDNYRVITASSAEEATRVTDGQLVQVDLLLADIVLPGVSGVVLADRLRSRHPDLRVLHMTAHPETLDSRRASVASHLPYLRKPFAVEQMLEAVAHALHD